MQKLYRLFVAISLAFLLSYSESLAKKDCNSEEHCAQICQQHQDELNSSTMHGQVYVCQLTLATQVILGDNPEEDETGAGTRRNYTCACVSYLNIGDEPIIRDPDRPGGAEPVPPYFPNPPEGDGTFIPGNPWTNCHREADRDLDQCTTDVAQKIDQAQEADLDENQKLQLQKEYNEWSDECEMIYNRKMRSCDRLRTRWDGECVFCLESIPMIK